MIKVSFNIVSRNDNYYSDNLEILSKTLNTNLFFLNQIEMISMVEFNVIDWGSKDPLHQNIKIYEKFKKNVNFFYVNKEAADRVSKNYPNKFNLNKSPNLAVRLSRGEFIIQGTSDQIMSRAGWFNLLNFIENKKIFNCDIDNTIFYIPRKILEFDFYKKNPSIVILEDFLQHYNSSYMKSKSSTFFIGGGYSLLCNKKLIEKMGGINNEENNPNSGNDADLNIRLKRLGVNQIDTNSLGIVFYKFPSDINAERNKLLKKKITRQYPAIPINNYPNGENWGMKNEKIEKYEPSNIIEDLNENNKISFILDNKYSTKLNISKLLGILSKFHNPNFDIKEWKLIFLIISIITSNRIFSFIEFGFDNINRLISIGQEIKSVELLSIDIESQKSEYFYLNRLGKVQEALSRKRFGKFTALNTPNLNEFKNNIDKIKFENGTNIFLINIASIKNNELLSKIEKQINDIKNFTSYIIFWDKQGKKNNFPNISQNFKKIYSNQNINIFVNNKIKSTNVEGNINLQDLSYYSIIKLLPIYLIYSIYASVSSLLKRIHKKLFKFKY